MAFNFEVSSEVMIDAIWLSVKAQVYSVKVPECDDSRDLHVMAVKTLS